MVGLKTIVMSGLLLNSFMAFSQFNVVSKDREVKTILLKVEQENSLEQSKAPTEFKVNVDSLHFKEERKAEIGFYPPLAQTNITSDFGMRFHPIDKINRFHYGVDLEARKDTVFAVFGGIVENSGYSRSLGYFVKINFKGYVAIYGHLSEYYVLQGDEVSTGDKIGQTGNTGKSTGEHLHFSLKRGDKYINPQILLNKLKYDL